MNKYLILGGTGFVGSNLSRALVSRGLHPRMLVRQGRPLDKPLPLVDKVDLMYGDYLDETAMRQAVEGVDIIFHLISTPHPNFMAEGATHDIQTNLQPMVRMLKICSASGVRKVVYLSSGGTVYGEADAIPIVEDHPTNPISSYGQTQLAIECYLKYISRTTPLEVNILRASNAYGPFQNPMGAQGIVAVAMGCALYNRKLTIYGKGEAVRDYIFISDVTDLMMMAADTPGSSIVNVSTGIGTSVMDLLREIEAVMGRSLEKEYAPARPGDVRVNVLANELAHRVYGWSPQVKLRDGLDRTWKHFSG
jgi:UDP-glucose 4-epimerase